MSHFEYVVAGELTPEFEEKTKELLKRIQYGTAFYNLTRYTDEPLEGDKKYRTIILTSAWNVWPPLFELLKGANATYMVYHKHRVM